MASNGPAPTRANVAPDRATFFHKIEDPNRFADRSKLEFTQTGDVSNVKPIRKVELALYEQGFPVDSGELREYRTPPNATFIRNIMDEFFPGQFKAQHPEGVRFVVWDRRGAFRGQLHCLGERPGSSCLETLLPPADIGNGDGELKLRLPALPDVTIKIAKELTIGELMALVELNFDI